MAHALPLTGIRVLELGAYISGPYAGAILSALGADVVKVEPPKGGDAFRRSIENGSPYFVQYNAGKRSIAVDLKKPEGVELVKSLLPGFDVFIENSRPGKTASLGLGPEVCKAINPNLIYSSVSGFGDGGPLCDRAAYDSIGQSMGGFYSIMNDPGTPRLTGTCVADLITAIITASGILAALVGRDRSASKEGGVVQTSLLEAMSSITIDAMTQMFETGESPTRQTRHPQAQNFCLLTASGGSITLHLSSSEKFWRALAVAMDREDLLEDPRFRRFADRQDNFWELKPIVEEEFKKRTREEWEERLTAEDVPFAPVLTMKEVAEHPRTQWLELIEPQNNGNTLVRPPWRFNGQRPARPTLAPRIGEHSKEIAAEVLSQSKIAELITSGVIVQAVETGQPADDAEGALKEATSGHLFQF
jgi:crotonobetainyl-CoA:carnitine CoA-transferase CaiB-like acyl-CoA transferase